MRSTDPTYPFFPIFSFLGFICCLVPLPWHLQAWNSGTCSFMIWTAAYCLVEFVNSVVWAGNVNNIAPVWCDISTQIMLGAAIGIPASSLCISRRLYNITSVQTALVTRQDKRRAVIIDLLIAVGLPFIVLILHIIVHPHRFDIFEDIGCYPVTYNTLPAYFLYLSWPVVLGVVSFTYSCRTLYSFWIRRAQFQEFVSSNHALSPSRYFRLMLLAFTDIMCTLPFGIFAIYNGARNFPLFPWISWEDTHFDFGRVELVPALVWRFDPAYSAGVELTRWLPVICAFIFFALFGFANEARRHYRLGGLWVAKRFGYTPAVKKAPKQSLPSWVAMPKSEGRSVSPPMYSPRPVPPKIPRVSIISSFDLSLYNRDVEKTVDLTSPGSTPPEYHQSTKIESHPTSSTPDSFSFRPTQSWVTVTDSTHLADRSVTPLSFTSISEHDTTLHPSHRSHRFSTADSYDDGVPRAI